MIYRLEMKLIKLILFAIAILVILVGFMILINETKIFKWISYTSIQPRESVTLKGEPKSNQIEFNSILWIENPKGVKLKLTGAGIDYSVASFWHDLDTDIIYDVENKNALRYIGTGNGLKKEILSNDNTSDVYVEGDGIVIQYRGLKYFDVTDNMPYTVTIQNISDKTAKIKVTLVDK